MVLTFGHLKPYVLLRFVLIKKTCLVFYLTLLQVARVVRKNDRPFGGIQLVLCGDFLQLPPVQKDKEVKFCFQVIFIRFFLRCIYEFS